MEEGVVKTWLPYSSWLGVLKGNYFLQVRRIPFSCWQLMNYSESNTLLVIKEWKPAISAWLNLHCLSSKRK